ncbi:MULTISPECIES: hypothetical protein [unclassified Brevundimonas]|uniref:hypothetical protein n=1 Tax=unclassified Brevundimonas TaxID=2622653 RepID=UPI003F92BFED
MQFDERFGKSKTGTYKQHQEYSQPVDRFFRHVFNAGVNDVAAPPRPPPCANPDKDERASTLDPRVKPEDDGVRKVLKTASSKPKVGRPKRGLKQAEGR